jgi:hypothetical protein
MILFSTYFRYLLHYYASRYILFMCNFDLVAALILCERILQIVAYEVIYIYYYYYYYYYYYIIYFMILP